MASLNSNGDIIIPEQEINILHFLILNANCYLVTKKDLTAIDKRATMLASELLGLIEKKRREYGKP